MINYLNKHHSHCSVVQTLQLTSLLINYEFINKVSDQVTSNEGGADQNSSELSSDLFNYVPTTDFSLPEISWKKH